MQTIQLLLVTQTPFILLSPKASLQQKGGLILLLHVAAFHDTQVNITSDSLEQHWGAKHQLKQLSI